MSSGERVAVVGGGTGALGRAVVTRLLADGWTVAVPARAPAEAAIAGAVHLIRCDLSVAADVDAFAAAVRDIGSWRALVNASGGWVAGRADAVSDEVIAAQLDLNLIGPWRLARAAAAAMRESGEGGAIVNVGSAAAITASSGSAAYQVSKAALARLTEVLAVELREARIRVNAVLPGTMDTPANRAAMPGADRRHWVSVDAVAESIAWLLSPAATAVTGALVPVA